MFEEQGYDTSQVMGEMLLTLYAMAAQEESLSISKNMRWSYQKRMETGSFVGTKPPMEFDLVNGQLIHNSDATTIQEIFHMFLSGIGMQRMADILNERNPDGKRWGRTSITAILKNERYVGAFYFKNDTQQTLYHSKKNTTTVSSERYIFRTTILV